METTRIDEPWRLIPHPGILHLDDLVAIKVIIEFGDEIHPGVKNNHQLEFWDQLPPGENGETLERKRKILVGWGGWKYDDDRPEVAGKECAATLAAKRLGVYDKPVLEDILRSTLLHDTKPFADPLHFSSLIKLDSRLNPGKLQSVYESAMYYVNLKFNEAKHFHSATRSEYEKKVINEIINGPGDEQLVFASIMSDDPFINNFARSKYAFAADVLFVMHPSMGHAQIFTNHKKNINLTELARILRYEELRIAGKILVTDIHRLGAVGELPEVPQWYLHFNRLMLLCGSETHPYVPPTALKFEDIRLMIKIALNPKRFHAKYERLCQKGICQEDRCFFYPYGLRRCSG